MLQSSASSLGLGLAPLDYSYIGLCAMTNSKYTVYRGVWGRVWQWCGGADSPIALAVMK